MERKYPWYSYRPYWKLSDTVWLCMKHYIRQRVRGSLNWLSSEVLWCADCHEYLSRKYDDE